MHATCPARDPLFASPIPFPLHDHVWLFVQAGAILTRRLLSAPSYSPIRTSYSPIRRGTSPRMPTFPISSHSMGASHWSPAALLASVRALPVLAHAGAKVVVGRYRHRRCRPGGHRDRRRSNVARCHRCLRCRLGRPRDDGHSRGGRGGHPGQQCRDVSRSGAGSILDQSHERAGPSTSLQGATRTIWCPPRRGGGLPDERWCDQESERECPPLPWGTSWQAPYGRDGQATPAAP